MQNPRLWNPESRLGLESWIQVSPITNAESLIWNPGSSAWNPDSKPVHLVLHGANFTLFTCHLVREMIHTDERTAI